MSTHAPVDATVPQHDQHDLHELLAARRSTRAFDDGHELPAEELRGLLEAARWAPSANNSQPWRFVVAQRGSAEFETLFGSLAEGNRAWAGAASALLLAAAESSDDTGSVRPWAVYDVGQAVAHLTVQAQAYGLDVHQMGGFDASAVRRELALPANVDPVVVIAVGVHGPDVVLPSPYAEREVAPRTRRPLPELLLAPAPADLPLSA
jgi:nitroreductase